MTDTSTTERTSRKQQGGQSKKASKTQPKQEKPVNDDTKNETPTVGEPEFVADNPPSGGGGTSQWDKVIDRLLNNDDTKPGTWYRLWTIGPDDVDDPAKDARRRANGIRGRVRKRPEISGVEVAVRPTGDGRHGVWVRLAKQTAKEAEATSAT